MNLAGEVSTADVSGVASTTPLRYLSQRDHIPEILREVTIPGKARGGWSPVNDIRGDSGGHDEAASKAAIESAIFGSGEAKRK